MFKYTCHGHMLSAVQAFEFAEFGSEVVYIVRFSSMLHGYENYDPSFSYFWSKSKM